MWAVATCIPARPRQRRSAPVGHIEADGKHVLVVADVLRQALGAARRESDLLAGGKGGAGNLKPETGGRHR
jgi:hypothetical protein